MAEALYMDDSYKKEFDAKVVSVTDGKFIVLEQTAFFPKGGGVQNDTGKLIRKSDGKEFSVIFAGKFSGEISHQVEPENDLKEGDEVHAIIDWDRRYKLMRSHTSAHILASLFHDELGAKITGNSIETEKCRMDFSLDEINRELIEEKIAKANELINNGGKVEVSYLPREEALKQDHLVKLANAMPPDVDTLRIVKITGNDSSVIDEQADGGCHVSDIKEIGKIVLQKIDNKGKNNRRLYWVLK